MGTKEGFKAKTAADKRKNRKRQAEIRDELRRERVKARHKRAG